MIIHADFNDVGDRGELWTCLPEGAELPAAGSDCEFRDGDGNSCIGRVRGTMGKNLVIATLRWSTWRPAEESEKWDQS